MQHKAKKNRDTHPCICYDSNHNLKPVILKNVLIFFIFVQHLLTEFSLHFIYMKSAKCVTCQIINILLLQHGDFLRLNADATGTSNREIRTCSNTTLVSTILLKTVLAPMVVMPDMLPLLFFLLI